MAWNLGRSRSVRSAVSRSEMVSLREHWEGKTRNGRGEAIENPPAPSLPPELPGSGL